ncbi:hypothetical protein TL16_g10449 [Triparma laevis f. inornata]|uniref:Uncharacterized protein n=1 Tax=Triparma laevis f. inornata TaxID=1714386 RepID=A0A9W7EPL3_9STRA|nr:hypothetical protein TL16_g10449 [Triparma laevis f. inornata]
MDEATWMVMLKVVLVLSMVSLTECFLTVGVAWLDIAEKAEKMGSGDKKFKWQRNTLKAGGAFMFTLCSFLAIVGKIDIMPQLILLAQLIVIIALAVGGYKLRRILRSAGNDSKLPWYIKRTNIGMGVAYLFNIGGGICYGMFNNKKLDTGIRGANSVGTVAMMTILGIGICGLAFSLNRFIADTTLKKIRKWQGKQVAVAPGGGGVADETMVSQARRNSSFKSTGGVGGSSPSERERSVKQ